jgi:ATP-binding cassette, subfamily B, bacterial MsbA
MMHLLRYPMKTVEGWWERQKQRWSLVRELFTRLQVRPRHLVTSVLLAAAVAIFDGIGLGLLAPLASGIIAGDFSGVIQHPVFIQISRYAPSLKNVLEQGFVQSFILLSGLIFAANVIRMMFDYANRVYGKHLQALFRMRMQSAVYDEFFSLGKRFFDKESQGHLRTHIQYADESIGIIELSRTFMQTLLRLIAYFAVLVLLSWKVALAIAVVAPLLHYSVKTLVARVKRFHQHIARIWMNKGREAFNTLSAMPLVWSYSQEGPSRQAFQKLNEEIRRLDLKGAFIGEIAVHVQEFIILTVLFSVIIYLAATGGIQQSETIASFLVFLYVAQKTLPMLNGFTRFRVGLAEQGPKLDHILKLFRQHDEHKIIDGTIPLRGLQKEIRLRHLSFVYQEGLEALRDVSFVCDRGTVTALVGPSGSGKSTIVSLLMRYYDCAPGMIYIDGKDIQSYTLRTLRGKMAYVSQDAYLIHDTLYNNVAYGLPKVRRQNVMDAVGRAQLTDLIERLPQGLQTEVGDRGVRLSGGEKQRVAIARAFLKNADVILLDEATSALDSKTEERVHEALDEIMQDRTALVIAHRLSTIRDADQVVYMNAGQVIEQGSFAELVLRRGQFYSQLQSQRLLVGSAN